MMLMPAAVLIVVLLAAISVDRAVVFGAQREPSPLRKSLPTTEPL